MKKLLIIGVSILILFFAGTFIFVKVGTKAVDKNDTKEILFTINNGDSRNTIIKNLNDAGLIKNKLSAIIYINIHRGLNLQAATYQLDRSMSLKQILTKFDKGEKYDDRKVINLKFVPGKRITDYAKTIADYLNEYQDPAVKVTKEDVINKINDPSYIKTLIDKYWFLTDEVLDSEIYYALEGYLQPETYQFYTTADINDIITKMLDATSEKLTPLKDEISKSGYTVHEVLSGAAIIEKEANSDEDRAMVSQVIHKRLDMKMALGMDVTAYYAAKAELTEPYYKSWSNLPSKYNTRNINNVGLPIGPICNPSISSIKAFLNPSNTNYVYFYADMKTVKVYFSEDYAGFVEIQEKLGV
jgi:UPF0755 protein